MQLLKGSLINFRKSKTVLPGLLPNHPSMHLHHHCWVNYIGYQYTVKSLLKLTYIELGTTSVFIKLLKYRHYVKDLGPNETKLLKPVHNAKTGYGASSFACSAPALWNDLSKELHNASSINVFKKCLKTHYFKKPANILDFKKGAVQSRYP